MTVRIGLLGCGTVGSGVVELVERRADKIAEITGLRPVISKILVRDIDKPREGLVEPSKLTTNASDILDDKDIGLVIETIGGIEPAREYILSALRSGKHVVTANKDLIALHGTEILETAERHQVDVLYEAAVGGAIPLIRPLKDSLASSDITDLKGIINGTTNYILSKMTQLGVSFETALADAQRLGYAESDPSSDVDGLDAARKLTILASIAFTSTVSLSDVRVQGIRNITASDVRFASQLGYVIKLLAVGTDRDGKLSLEVRPSLVPNTHPLAHVSESYNALYVRGDASGDLMFFGQGAGSLPTASAVVGDVIEALRNLQLGVSGHSQQVYASHKQAEPSRDLLPYYMRLSAQDEPGVFAQIAQVFGETEVSMSSVLQTPTEEGHAEIVVVSHKTSSQHIDTTLMRLRQIEQVIDIHTVMPVES
ncbi:homoserine dehydrogenase [Alicyclobacillus curvatus]|nr:homoserine dehydrogenase [Alicyclobacillus curvatus]